LESALIGMLRGRFAALLLFLAAGLIAVVAMGSPAAAADSPSVASVQVSAHRGGAGQWPQNSMLAFRHALAAGYDEIEADSWLTRDHYAVIYHDHVISRSRCGGPQAGRLVWRLTLAELMTVRCDGQPIPTVGSLLRRMAAAPASRTVLRLEVKSPPGQTQASAGEWARRISRNVVLHGLTGRTIMQDFNWYGFAGIRAASPRLRISALIAAPTYADIRRAASLGAYDLSYAAAHSTPALNEYIRARGLLVAVWNVDGGTSTEPALTVSDAEGASARLSRLACGGVGTVITNFPDLFRQVRTTATCPVS
jgi:glycerophosphoryl diester phosphodiesterase